MQNLSSFIPVFLLDIKLELPSNVSVLSNHIKRNSANECFV